MHYRLILLFLISARGFSQEVTYFGAIRPLIEKHCTACHQANGTAPFSLETYESVAKRSKMIKAVTASRYMPPWKANTAYQHFANERMLSDSEITVIAKWVDSGAPKGRKHGGNRQSQASSGSRTPDLVLKMPEPFLIPGDNKQHFYCYKIPFEISAEMPVEAIEFVPGNRKMVHHASYQVVETGPVANIHSKPYFFEYNTEINHVEDLRDFNFLNLTDSVSGFVPKVKFHTGWLPGTGKHHYPEGIGFTMPKRGVLLIRNLHYSQTPVPQQDQSEVRIYFAKAPVKRILEFAAFKPRNLKPIIPKDSVVTYYLTLNIGSDLSVLNINPHMHKLGKYFKAFAVTPSNDTIRLIEIKDWDFNWQEFYRFKKMIKIPKGSKIEAEARYDNTARNMNNPNKPPIDVYFERGNMDDDREEMMRLVFVYLPYKEGDEEISLEEK